MDLAMSDAPIITSIPAQNANQVLTVVYAFRKVVDNMAAPDQKTKLPRVSAVFAVVEFQASLNISTTNCRNAKPTQNWKTAV